jgi:hypothetical protein
VPPTFKAPRMACHRIGSRSRVGASPLRSRHRGASRDGRRGGCASPSSITAKVPVVTRGRGEYGATQNAPAAALGESRRTDWWSSRRERRVAARWCTASSPARAPRSSPPRRLAVAAAAWRSTQVRPGLRRALAGADRAAGGAGRWLTRLRVRQARRPGLRGCPSWRRWCRHPRRGGVGRRRRRGRPRGRRCCPRHP